MTLANDSATLPATGTVVATHLANSMEYQAMVLADAGGHIVGTRDAYRLFVPSSAVGANKVFFDLFNASGSGVGLRLVQARVFPNLDTAVTGTLGIQAYLTRTSTIGTGGTASTTEGTSLTAATISKLDPGAATLNTSITARLAPTGGATAGALIGHASFFTEETNAGAAVAAALGGDFLKDSGYDIVISEGTGCRVVQGSVASVGNVVFVFDFVLA
ncbi:MAG: hypothetical protein H7099_17535 [Gemmatimonadaceae bacterium]|nr:hypothetical protein [Gemmatimonadaceae bacterium]